MQRIWRHCLESQRESESILSYKESMEDSGNQQKHKLWLVKLGVVRSGFLVKIFIHASQCHCTWILTALNHLKHCCICRLHDYVRHSPNHFVTEVNHNHGEAHSGSSPFCYWGQTQAWLHTLTEQPNFWTRAIRTWSHNASHRANLNLWLRALSVLAYFVRVGAGRFFR